MQRVCVRVEVCVRLYVCMVFILIPGFYECLELGFGVINFVKFQL